MADTTPDLRDAVRAIIEARHVRYTNPQQAIARLADGLDAIVRQLRTNKLPRKPRGKGGGRKGRK